MGPPYNFAFLLVTNATFKYVDPRPRQYWRTELERVWSGPSTRYWQHNASILHSGVDIAERSCTDFIYYGYTAASPEACGDNFQDCCVDIDSANFLAGACNIGVAPTVCRNINMTMLKNDSKICRLAPRL